MLVETVATYSILILRSPPKAGDSKDGRREKLSNAIARLPRDRIAHFSISGTIRRGRNSDTLGQTMTAASTSSIGISMITVSFRA